MTPSQFRFRPVKFPDDAAQIAEIIGVVWHGGASAIIEARYGRVGNTSWQEHQARDILNALQCNNVSAYLVEDSEQEGKIAGFCSFQVDKERDMATVGYNAVAPSHQGKGIGTLMMRYIMDRIRESGVSCAAVVVADNDAHLPARRIYEKAGFQTVYGLRYLFQKL